MGENINTYNKTFMVVKLATCESLVPSWSRIPLHTHSPASLSLGKGVQSNIFVIVLSRLSTNNHLFLIKMLSKLWQKKKIKSHFKIAAPPGTVGELSIISVACDQHLCFFILIIVLIKHHIITGSCQQGASKKVETQGENEQAEHILFCCKFKFVAIYMFF